MPVFAMTGVGRDYRLTAPLEVRKLLGIDEDDEIGLVFEDNEVVVRKRNE